MDTATIGLLQELLIEKTNNQEQYANYLKQGIFSMAAFVYFDKHPTIDVIAWRLSELNGVPQVESLYSYDIGSVNLATIDHLNKDSAEFKKIMRDSINPKKYVTEQIMIEHSHHPNDIDATIDVYRLSTSGEFKQLTRKRNCDSLRAAHPELYFWYNN